jgi:glycosyltransferase involved in cell wall biosynthesis
LGWGEEGGVRKLIIQVPCLNEEAQLPQMLADLPRSVPGVDVVEWLVIDDGSGDRTAEVARAHGVDHIVRLPRHQGLATAFQAGLDAALKLGADVVVNTDADNQYAGSDIPALIAPIIEGRADLVIGDRDVLSTEHFSATKKRLQRIGGWVVRRASGTDVPDVTSGFRAYNREAALGLVVLSRYTYTLESLIQAGKGAVSIAHVRVTHNPATRPSRLMPSMWAYVRRNASSLLRVYAAYEPLRFFAAIAALLALGSLAAWSPFLYDWIAHGDRTGHLQSIVLGGVLLLAAVQVLALGILADLVVANRLVGHRILERVRRLELAAEVEPSRHEAVDHRAPPSAARATPPG